MRAATNNETKEVKSKGSQQHMRAIQSMPVLNTNEQRLKAMKRIRKMASSTSTGMLGGLIGGAMVLFDVAGNATLAKKSYSEGDLSSRALMKSVSNLRLGVEPLPLTNDNLTKLSGALVALPQYDRKAVTVGIVHLGIGAFHRSHQAFYTQKLFSAHGLTHAESTRWGICGVTILDDQKMKRAMDDQDCLYTLVERSQDGEKAMIVGSVIKFLNAPDSPEAVIAQMAEESVGIISLTITEKGYCDDGTGHLDEKNPFIVRDLQNPSSPASAIGYICAALNRRRKTHNQPVTLLSCDNITHNGTLLETMVVSLARLVDGELAAWIESKCSFPCTMVDRITPGTTADDVDHLASTCGIEDQWPVMCEPFSQWVMEDKFVAGRPSWEKVGAQFVEDVAPYEVTKLRVLNAAHSVLAYPAGLLGATFVHEAIQTPFILNYVKGFMEEITPTLPQVTGLDVDVYKETIIRRFGNPYIQDQLYRIAEDGSKKIAVFLMPILRQKLASGKGFSHIAFTVATWMKYMAGVDERGKNLVVKDPLLAALQLDAKVNPMVIMRNRLIFGDDIPEAKQFGDEVQACLSLINTYGIQEAIYRKFSPDVGTNASAPTTAQNV